MISLHQRWNFFDFIQQSSNNNIIVQRKCIDTKLISSLTKAKVKGISEF